VDNEYIELNEAYFKPAQIQILIDQNQIQELYKNKPKFESFLKQLIRSFEGLFFQLRDVDLGYFAKKHHYAMDEVYANLNYLHKQGIIQYIAQSNHASIRFLVNKIPEQKIMLDSTCYLERKKIFEKQIDAMLHYLTQCHTCRSQVLLEYFGEKDSPVCHQCDIDKKANRGSTSNEEILSLKDNIHRFISDRNVVIYEDIQREFSNYSDQLLRKILDRMVELELISKVGLSYQLKK